MNDLKDKNKITKRKNDRKSSNIHGGGREFYASKNLFPSFVLEIQSQSPASLFSPHSHTHFRAPISIFTHPTLELNYTPKVGWDEAATRLRGDHKEDSFHSFLSQLCHFVTFFFLLTFFLTFSFLSHFSISERDYFSMIINDHL